MSQVSDKNDDQVELGDSCSELSIENAYKDGREGGENGEEEKDRIERREAGYVSVDVADPTNGYDKCDVQGGGHSMDGSDRIFQWLIRPGTGGNKHVTVLAEQFLPELRGTLQHGQTRIVRESIIIDATTQRINEEIQRISTSLSKKGTVYCIARHDEPFTHFHVVHACPWRYYCCRCYDPRQPRRSCRTTQLSDATLADWNRIFEYLCSNGRQLQYLHSGVTSYKRLCGIEYVPDERLRGLSRWEEPMEACNKEVQSSLKHTRDDDAQLSVGFSSEPNKKRPKFISKARCEELESMIMEYATVPLQSITNSNIWQGSKFRYIDANNSTFRDAISSIRKRMSTWNMEAYINFYSQNKNILWEAIQSNFDDHYMKRGESLLVMDELLQLQYFDYSAANGLTLTEGVQHFLKEVYDITEKRQPKRNTLELIGPAGSGKSYFADMVCAFYLNVGHARNWVRTESFPLQSCVNRRIILWNEAQVEPSSYDSAKLLLGGDPCPANIKYMDINTIARTPVIITANQRLIPNNDAFKQRMIRYTWVSAPFLKDYSKKPHPLTYYDLLRSYHVIDNDVLL